jgi:tripartite-type tricarboxylate transporter receptor subunit TctC
VSSWYGVCAAAGTPPPVLDKINADVNSVLRMPEIRQRLDDLLMVGPPTSREDFDQFIRMEIAKWAKVIKEAGIQQQ